MNLGALIAVVISKINQKPSAAASSLCRGLNYTCTISALTTWRHLKFEVIGSNSSSICRMTEMLPLLLPLAPD